MRYFKLLSLFVFTFFLTPEIEAENTKPKKSDTTKQESKKDKSEDKTKDKKKKDDPLKEIKKEVEKLKLEEEKLGLKLSLQKKKLEEELISKTLEMQKAQKQAEIELASQRELHKKQKLEIEKLSLDIQLLQKKAQKKNTVASIKIEEELSDLRMENKKLAIKSHLSDNKLKIKEAEFNIAQMNYDQKIMEYEAIVSEINKRKEVERYTRKKPSYLVNPLSKDGRTLTISDRRISLDGIVTMDLASKISNAINYFNNKDKTPPIFLIINASPGGSVMAGYRILKAMEESEAPVYVVLKSFAASMSATIVTLAEKSFAYKNAIILHHQILALTWGNMTDIKQQTKELEEWWKRLAKPVAQKMGISLDEYVKKMYSKYADGDWREFADKAQKLKWVDHIIEEIQETSIDKSPEEKNIDSSFSFPFAFKTKLELKKNIEGVPYEVLPRLQPFDYYFIYNPDSYYKTR